jgi:serine/threonine-protein kinase RsbW
MSLTMAREWHRGGPGAHQRWNVFRLPALTSSVGSARRLVRNTLGDWGLTALCDDVGLIISELFTNVVVHTESAQVTCALWTAGGLLNVEVSDEGRARTVPSVREAGVDAENGRGLMLVEHLTDEWGVRPSEPGRGRTVWARLPCASGPSASVVPT